MSIGEIWGKIPKAELSSDQPNEFVAGVVKVAKGVGKKGGETVILTLRKVDGTQFTTNYKIPLAWTGKGQGDLLNECLKALGMASPMELEGKAFRWKRMELSGSMKGFDRHYPIALVKGKLT